MFILAPIVTMTLALVAWAVIPMSEEFVLADINVGILYLFAVSSLGVYGIIMESLTLNILFWELFGLPRRWFLMKFRLVL